MLLDQSRRFVGVRAWQKIELIFIKFSGHLQKSAARNSMASERGLLNNVLQDDDLLAKIFSSIPFSQDKISLLTVSKKWRNTLLTDEAHDGTSLLDDHEIMSSCMNQVIPGIVPGICRHLKSLRCSPSKYKSNTSIPRIPPPVEQTESSRASHERNPSIRGSKFCEKSEKSDVVRHRVYLHGGRNDQVKF